MMTPKIDFFLPLPTVALSIEPHIISLFTITSQPSFGDMSGAGFMPAGKFSDLGSCILWHLHSTFTKIWDSLFGRMRTLKICLPVHSLTGFQIVGGGWRFLYLH